ncbi:MAG: DUF4199 domain-containing protein [Flammeovirgaceae bacterium]
MAPFQNPLVRISLRNGLIAGLFACAALVALYAIGKHPMLFQVFFDFRIILFGLFFTLTLKELRDNFQEGVLHFWQGMLSCLSFTAVFALVTTIFIVLLCNFYTPFLTNYIELGLAQAKALPAETVKEIGKEVYDNMINSLPNVTGWALARKYCWQSFIISFFFSIIISVILRRQPNNQ